MQAAGMCVGEPQREAAPRFGTGEKPIIAQHPH
jgi:hypothetical protein